MPRKRFKAAAQKQFPQSPLDRIEDLQPVDPNSPWLRKLEAAAKARLNKRPGTGLDPKILDIRLK